MPSDGGSTPLATYPLLVATAAGLALVATPLVRALAVRVGAIDELDPARVHERRVPRLGGLALVVAALGAPMLVEVAGFPVRATLGAHGWRLGWLLAGIAVIVGAGVVDDVRGLAPVPKLLLQVVAAALALAGGYGLQGVTNPFTGSYVAFGVLGTAALTVLWIVLVTNALNLIDGLDGLASGVALIASVTLLIVALSEGRADAAIWWATLIGALGGFLCYNFNPASIFLGDTGSLLLGYLLSVLSIQSLQKGAAAVVILVPILALGVPIIDTLLALLRRSLRSGLGSIFRADRGHVHDRLLESGMSHRGAVLALYGACVALSALAFLAVAVQGVGNAVVVGLGALGSWIGIRSLRYDVRARAAARHAPRREDGSDDRR
jgi:UDP-GlcNAc:undecaprenyl-phosphate/decaprenyl-phosphate GlcNAc-1-phosphate transferase